jgi:hypothetical protein
MNRRDIAVLICFGLAVAVVSNPAQAITLQPGEATSKDTFVYQFLPTFNFDAGGFGTLLSAGKTGVGHDTESLLQFDLSTVGLTAAQVTSATFNIFVGSTSAAGFGLSPDAGHPIQIDLLPITGSWTESGANWGNAPITGAQVSSVTISGINQYVSFDVTSLVKQWLNGSLANNGLLLRQDAVVGTNPNFYVAVFDSSAGNNPPSLSVVPEPTSIVLALGALPAVAWAVRRRTTRKSMVK